MRTHPLRVVVVAPTHKRARDFARSSGLRPGFWDFARDVTELRGRGPGHLILFLSKNWPDAFQIIEVRAYLETLSAFGSPVVEVCS